MAAVPTSQNGWTVFTSGAASGLVVSPWVTGRIRGGDVATVLNWVCARFNAEVEHINRSESWGYAYRPIAGQTTGFSNHASGTAVDLNATKHPLNATGTFTAAQLAALHAIRDHCDGVIRLGVDYMRRPDPMHIEIVGTEAQVAALAARIRAGQIAHTTATNPTATKSEEDDMTPEQATQLATVLTKVDALVEALLDRKGIESSALVESITRRGARTTASSYQVSAAKAGYSGLGRGGRSSKDDGPRPSVIRDWRAGLKWLDAQSTATPTVTAKPTTPKSEEDDMTPEQSAKLDAVYAAVAERAGIERAGDSAARQTAAYPVQRGGEMIPMIQEIADAKTGIIALSAKVAALTSAVGTLAKGQGVDMAAVEAAAERGARAALDDATVTIDLGGAS